MGDNEREDMHFKGDKNIGGANDFVMSCFSKDSLRNFALEMMEKELIDWWHIYDSEVEIQRIIEGSYI